MLIDFLVISIAVGLIRRGNFRGLAAIPLRKVEFIFLSFIIRYLPLFLRGRLYELAVKYNVIIAAAAYAALLYGLASNWHIKAMRPVALGVFLNFLVIAVNGGKMPVSLKAVETAGLADLKLLLFDRNYLYHAAVNSATKLKFLGDVIPLPPPYPKPRVFSIGDFIMGLGIFFTIQQAMLKKSSTSDKII
ncbi:DUF5317 domain-containing protein [Thermoanaerobacterium sp. DL9XJH110]|uniref:DUF5317 domain-containing protein n=1 Tax=Thermoanaerobacterium sp. DL9XJH110 TaxID=3386643 RepID=UPI003BB7A2A2